MFTLCAYAGYATCGDDDHDIYLSDLLSAVGTDLLGVVDDALCPGAGWRTEVVVRLYRPLLWQWDRCLLGVINEHQSL